MKLNEEQEKWVIDGKASLVGAVGFIVTMCFLFLFAILSIKVIVSIDDPYIQSALTIGWMFTNLKMLGMVGHPVIEYKERIRK